MRESLVDFICCPVARSPLELRQAVRDPHGGDILEGVLCSPEGRIYRISDGIPQLTVAFRTDAEAATVKAFGREWARYDDFQGVMGSADLFTAFTGLGEDQVRDRTVLEVGCGGGRWLKVLAALGAREVVGLDLSTAVVQAARRTATLRNVHVVRGSALEMPLTPRFDLVVSVGVVHHLADPVLGLQGIRKAAAADHLVVIWVYAREGNELYLSAVRPLRWLARYAPEPALVAGSRVLAAAVWLYVRTLNRAAVATGLRLPLRDYLDTVARLRFRDMESVVYDQLTPQIARYPTREEVLDWVHRAGGRVDRLHHRTGNSWQCHFRFGEGTQGPEF